MTNRNEYDNTIRDLDYRFEAVVRHSNHRHRRAKRSIDFNWDDPDGNPVTNFYHEVDCCEIIIPKDRLGEFLETQESQIVRIARRERELREQYPAVKSAWEQYQLILALVR